MLEIIGYIRSRHEKYERFQLRILTAEIKSKQFKTNMTDMNRLQTPESAQTKRMWRR